MQFEFPGSLAVPDGSYLARDPAGRERVLVIETLAAPPPPARRRRQTTTPRSTSEPPSVSLARATAVSAYLPFDSAQAASTWLEETAASTERLEGLVEEGLGLVNRAVHASAVATGDPRFQEQTSERALRVRFGYGTGEELSAGRFSVIHDMGPGRPPSQRAQRQADLRPQEGIAAALGGRERIDACETLVLRVSAEIAAGRLREAALQLPAAARAVQVELASSMIDAGHQTDMEKLAACQGEVEAIAAGALQGSLSPTREQRLRELAGLAERVLRRRRVRRG